MAVLSIQLMVIRTLI